MKKSAIICGLAVFGAISFTSCNGTGTQKEDNEICTKIQNKEALAPDDYTIIINYVGEYAEKAQDYVVNAPLDEEKTAEFDKLKAEYPCVDIYRDCIKATPLDAFTPEQMQLIEKYAGYIEFAAPEGFNIQTEPDAAGLEMQTPTTEDGVVAGPQLEETVKTDRDW